MPEATVRQVMLLQLISICFIGVIIVVGLAGNLGCIMFILRARKWRLPSNQFLLALIVADFAFLLSLLVTWLNSFGVPLYDMPVVCELVNYTSYVFCSLSSWFVVGLTFERFFVIYYPFQRHRVSHPARINAAIVAMTFVAYALNIWVPLSHEAVLVTSSEQNETQHRCKYTAKNEPTYEAMNVVDTIVACVLPACAVCILNVLIVYQLLRASKMRQRLLTGDSITMGQYRRVNGLTPHTPSPRSRPQSLETNVDATDGHVILAPPVHDAEPEESPARFKRAISSQSVNNFHEMRITKMLLLISSVYLLLNLPSYLFRIVNDYVDEMTQLRMSTVAYLLFYSQYSINFVLYALNKRKAVAKMMRKLRKML